MKRTTLKFEEGVLRRLKQRAAAEGRTLQDLANELIRRGLAVQEHDSYTLELAGWEATPQPGVDLLDRDALFDVMNGR